MAEIVNDRTPILRSRGFTTPHTADEQQRMLETRRRKASPLRANTEGQTGPTHLGLGLRAVELPPSLADANGGRDDIERFEPMYEEHVAQPRTVPNPLLAALTQKSSGAAMDRLPLSLERTPPMPPDAPMFSSDEVPSLERSPEPSEGGRTVRPQGTGATATPPLSTTPPPLVGPRPTEFAPQTPVHLSGNHLGWGLKDQPERLRNFIEHDRGDIENILSERFGWRPSLDGLEVEFVTRKQARVWLHTDCELTTTMSWLLSWVLPMHYSPSLSSRSPTHPGEEVRRGRLLVVAPNVWWLADSQLHYQLCQMMVLAAVHASAPATIHRLQLYQTQPRLAQYLRDGLGGVMWGLSEVIATHQSIEARAPQHTFKPWTWWHARTLWQRIGEWILGFFAKSELSPRAVGRRIAAQLVGDVRNSPQVIARSLVVPGATTAVCAPTGHNAIVRLKPAEARQHNYKRDLFREDVAFWERYNPNRGAIGYAFEWRRRPEQ